MKQLLFISLSLLLFSSCGGGKSNPVQINSTPLVTNNGQTIQFSDSTSLAFFKAEPVASKNLSADLVAPGKIAATIVASATGASQNIALFENPDLASNYTQLIQHQININQIQHVNIKQKQTELSRVTDLQQHGAATGQELLNAQVALTMEQTNLANEKAALIEHEAKLKSGGFDPSLLMNAAAGIAYVICDLPENQVGKIKSSGTCSVAFTAFPNENFTGKIDGVADVVDNVTRMVKVRISVNNGSGKLKSGMFANVSFGLNEGNFIGISKNSLITVQGTNYVFVKKSDNQFERREIQIGQQFGDRIVVFAGLKDNDVVVIEGVMQLKGLSFGY